MYDVKNNVTNRLKLVKDTFATQKADAELSLNFNWGKVYMSEKYKNNPTTAQSIRKYPE